MARGVAQVRITIENILMCLLYAWELECGCGRGSRRGNEEALCVVCVCELKSRAQQQQPLLPAVTVALEQILNTPFRYPKEYKAINALVKGGRVTNRTPLWPLYQQTTPSDSKSK
jgi:hypothetical protein